MVLYKCVGTVVTEMGIEIALLFVEARILIVSRIKSVFNPMTNPQLLRFSANERNLCLPFIRCLVQMCFKSPMRWPTLLTRV
jgi:hypothetical protein